MPRTKRAKPASNSTTNTKVNKGLLKSFFESLDEEAETFIERIDNDCERNITKIKMYFQELTVQKQSYLNKTMEEILATGFVSASTTTTFSTTNAAPPIHSTAKKLSDKPKRSSRTRNKSKDDEGYLTAGSRASSLTRESRKKTITVKKNNRRSRSCSNNNADLINFVTPANKQPPNFGCITPKVKLNTPQAILRRPDMGEVAYSVQGSPIMVSDSKPLNANINIPLKSGRVISLQPFGTLNDSQIPTIEKDMLEEMNMLQQHLLKCIEKNKNN